MGNWIIITFLYAILIGFFSCAQKKAIEKNSIYEVTACFSLISLILVSFIDKDFLNIELMYILIILAKSLIVSSALVLSLFALKEMSVSLHSIVNLSGIIFSIILSVIFLNERITTTCFIGIIIVLMGLFLVNIITNKKSDKEASLKGVIFVLISCFLYAIAAIVDKKILVHITTSQFQFWYLLFSTVIYVMILIINQKKFDFKEVKGNYWIVLMAFCLTIADKLWFIGNQIPESKVSIMIMIKQISVVETVILGKIMFKEKNIISKLACSVLIIFGIVLTLL